MLAARMLARNSVESLNLKNTTKLYFPNKDLRTFKPLFPPFGQSKPGRPLTTAMDDLKAGSSDIKDIKSRVDSSITETRTLFAKRIDDELKENWLRKEDVNYETSEKENLGVVVADGDKQEEATEPVAKGDPPFEWYDADYQEWEGSLEEETHEMDYRGRREDPEKEKKLWSLTDCDSLASITDEVDIDEDYTEVTEPLLAHLLTVPYARTPKPRFFSATEKVKYVLETLPRRPPSPVRHVLPLRFDLRAAAEKLREENSHENEIRNYLRESRNRISGELMQMLEDGVEANTMIGSLVLRLILEEVVLTIDFDDHGIDVHTFLTIATTMALRELKISCASESSKPSYDDGSLDKNWESFFPRRDDNIEDDSKGTINRSESWQLRNALRKVHNPRLPESDLLHYCLPWHLICPSHERGHTGSWFYSNLRDRIDEILGDSQPELEQAYVADVTCYHLKEHFPSALRDMLEKRRALQARPEVSFCWKPATRDIVEFPFWLFAFV